MTIRFPTRGGRYLESITACGRVKAKQFGGPSKAKRDRIDIEGVKRGFWYRLAASQASDGKDVHFHFDAARLSEHGKTNPPAHCEPMRSLENLFGEFANKRIDVVATGRFAFPLSKLKPDSVISVLLGVRVGHDEFSAKLAGSMYEIDAGPVFKVLWSIHESEDGDDVILATIESLSENVIDDDYLDKLAETLHAAFKTIILEEGVEQ